MNIHYRFDDLELDGAIYFGKAIIDAEIDRYGDCDRWEIADIDVNEAFHAETGDAVAFPKVLLNDDPLFIAISKCLMTHCRASMEDAVFDGAACEGISPRSNYAEHCTYRAGAL